jgi:hypothetical protein
VTKTEATTPDAAAPEVRMPEVNTRARFVVAGIAIVIAIGIGLRFLTKSDLWLDEALSVNIARLPVSQIPRWLKHDGAPPLYYVLLHYWMQVFGTSDVATRSLSGVFSVASLPLAQTTVVGIPMVTSRAKLGPDSAATRFDGACSRKMRLIVSPVSNSIPFVTLTKIPG